MVIDMTSDKKYVALYCSYCKRTTKHKVAKDVKGEYYECIICGNLRKREERKAPLITSVNVPEPRPRPKKVIRK